MDNPLSPLAIMSMSVTVQNEIIRLLRTKQRDAVSFLVKVLITDQEINNNDLPITIAEKNSILNHVFENSSPNHLKVILNILQNCLSKISSIEKIIENEPSKLEKWLNNKKGNRALPIWEINYINRIRESKSTREKLEKLQEYLITKNMLPHICNLEFIYNMINQTEIFQKFLMNLMVKLIPISQNIQFESLQISHPLVTQIAGELFLRILADREILTTNPLKEDKLFAHIKGSQETFYKIENKQNKHSADCFLDNNIFDHLNFLIQNPRNPNMALEDNPFIDSKTTEMLDAIKSIVLSPHHRDAIEKYPTLSRLVMLFWLRHYRSIPKDSIRKVLTVKQLESLSGHKLLIEGLFNIENEAAKFLMPIFLNKDEALSGLLKELSKTLQNDPYELITILSDAKSKSLTGKRIKEIEDRLNRIKEIEDRLYQTLKNKENFDSGPFNSILQRSFTMSGRAKIESTGLRKQPLSLQGLIFRTIFTNPTADLQSKEELVSILERGLEYEVKKVEESAEEIFNECIENLFDNSEEKNVFSGYSTKP